MRLTSERIEVSDPLEAIEYCYRQNMTDGLPVVPPTETRVVIQVRRSITAAGLSAWG